MLIKMKRESIFGKAGKEVEVSEGVGIGYLKQGCATEVESAKSKKVKGSGIRNKSLSAAS